MKKPQSNGSSAMTALMPFTAELLKEVEQDYAGEQFAPPQPGEPDSGFLFDSLVARVAFMQEKFFRDQPVDSVLKHLRREAKELRDRPDDIEEGADILLLLLAWLFKTGKCSEALLFAAHAKIDLNQRRKWRTDRHGVITHVEGGR